MTAGELTQDPASASSEPAHVGHVAHVQHATTKAHGNPEVLLGPLSSRALLRLDEALRLADSSTGLTFSVYIGELREPVREVLFPFPMFGHDRGRGVSDEVFIGQFLPHRHELGFHFRDFFPEALAFRGKINQSFQRQIKFPQRR